MSKLERNLITILIIISCAGCANYQTVVHEASTQDIGDQISFFESLYKAQPRNEVMGLLNEESKIINSLQALNEEKLYSYVMIHNLKTNLIFGLYFENENLDSLIFDEDAKDFFTCRVRENKYWQYGHISQYQKWLKGKNKLGTVFDKRYHAIYSRREATTSNTVATTLMVAPLAAVTAPFWAPGLIHSKKAKKTEVLKLKAATEIPLGSSEQELLILLGKNLSFKRVFATYTVFSFHLRNLDTHSSENYTFGLSNKKIIWKEKEVILHGHKNSYLTKEYKTSWSNANCDSLKSTVNLEKKNGWHS